MTQLVAVCADVPAPPEGATLGSCSQVVWEAQSTPELSQADVEALLPAVLVLFAVAFVWRVLRKVV